MTILTKTKMRINVKILKGPDCSPVVSVASLEGATGYTTLARAIV